MLQAVAVLIFVEQDAVVGSRDDFADGVDPEGARRATVELIPLLPGLRHAIRRLSHAGESMGVAHAPSSDGIDGDTRVRDAQALYARPTGMHPRALVRPNTCATATGSALLTAIRLDIPCSHNHRRAAQG